MAGMEFFTAWGKTTLIMLCQLLIPRERAASVWPRSIAWMPPRRTSVRYAVELRETVQRPEMKKLQT